MFCSARRLPSRASQERRGQRANLPRPDQLHQTITVPPEDGEGIGDPGARPERPCRSVLPEWCCPDAKSLTSRLPPTAAGVLGTRHGRHHFPEETLSGRKTSTVRQAVPVRALGNILPGGQLLTARFVAATGACGSGHRLTI